MPPNSKKKKSKRKQRKKGCRGIDDKEDEAINCAENRASLPDADAAQDTKGTSDHIQPLLPVGHDIRDDELFKRDEQPDCDLCCIKLPNESDEAAALLSVLWQNNMVWVFQRNCRARKSIMPFLQVESRSSSLDRAVKE
jgi:hypothetical protein